MTEREHVQKTFEMKIKVCVNILAKCMKLYKPISSSKLCFTLEIHTENLL